MVIVSTLAAYLRTEAPSQTPAIPTVAVDDVEPLDYTAAEAVVVAAADAVDAVGATLMRVCSLASNMWSGEGCVLMLPAVYTPMHRSKPPAKSWIIICFLSMIYPRIVRTAVP